MEQTVAELVTFAHDPRSILSLPRSFQVWGRKASTAPVAGC
jgi:hypothetical protein